MDERPVDDGAPVTPPLRQALCADELIILAEQCAGAIAAVAESLLPVTGLVRPQALGVMASALLTTVEGVATILLTIPEGTVDRAAASAEIARTRQTLLHGVQILYQRISEVGERTRIITPPRVKH